MSGEARILRFRGNVDSAEGVLRDALSECAAIRADGKEIFLVLLMGEEQCLPSIGRTPMFTTDLLACSARLQIEAMESIREFYESDCQDDG